MTHFPLFFELKNKSIIIFGGGDHAFQRVVKLKPFSPHIRVISESVSEKIKAVDGITVEERAFEVSDLDDPPIIAVVAESREKSALICTECRKKHIPVNAVDMPELCDVIFPSVVATENLCIGISSGGISPTATLEFKDRIEAMISENTDDILEWMPYARDLVKSALPREARNPVLRAVFSRAMELDRTLSDAEIYDIIALKY